MTSFSATARQTWPPLFSSSLYKLYAVEILDLNVGFALGKDHYGQIVNVCEISKIPWKIQATAE